jgi:hypothetical protein
MIFGNVASTGNRKRKFGEAADNRCDTDIGDHFDRQRDGALIDETDIRGEVRRRLIAETGLSLSKSSGRWRGPSTSPARGWTAIA